MNLFRKRNLLIALAAFIIGITAAFAAGGFQTILARDTTVKSQVASYLLNDEGSITGLLLASGDQLRFSPGTGEWVAGRIKVGDEVSATGRAGSRSSYGREIRVRQLNANGQTITEAARPHPPRPGHPIEGAQPAHPAPPPGQEASQSIAPPPVDGQAVVATATNEQTAGQTSATGTIRAHLVGGRGEVNGLILSGGEQVRFSPKVGELVIAAEANNAQAQVTVEGNGVRNERGAVIRPVRITVGNQTIALQ